MSFDRATYQREWHQRNREYVNAKQRERRAKHRRMLNALKRKCALCGEDHPSCLDFHHPDGTKEFNLADGASLARSWKKIQAEAERCVVLCANCHRKHHSRP